MEESSNVHAQSTNSFAYQTKGAAMSDAFKKYRRKTALKLELQYKELEKTNYGKESFQ